MKLEFVPCRRNEIQLDLDAKTPREGNHRRRKFFSALNVLNHQTGFRYKTVTVTRSKSGNGFHATITLCTTMPILNRVFFAAILGSDSWRELFNYCRVIKHSPIPVLFFERKRATKRKLQAKKRTPA